MAVQHFYINEEIFYEYYESRINCLIRNSEQCDGMKPFDAAVLHCVYNNGNIDKGRFLSPIYRTIISLHDGYSMPGIIHGNILICLR